METYKSKTKQGGEIIIHTNCSLEELHEQIPGTDAFKKRMMGKIKECEETKQALKSSLRRRKK